MAYHACFGQQMDIIKTTHRLQVVFDSMIGGAWKMLKWNTFGYTMVYCKSSMQIWDVVNSFLNDVFGERGWVLWLCGHRSTCQWDHILFDSIVPQFNFGTKKCLQLIPVLVSKHVHQRKSDVSDI